MILILSSNKVKINWDNIKLDCPNIESAAEFIAIAKAGQMIVLGCKIVIVDKLPEY